MPEVEYSDTIKPRECIQLPAGSLCAVYVPSNRLAYPFPLRSILLASKMQLAHIPSSDRLSQSASAGPPSQSVYSDSLPRSRNQSSNMPSSDYPSTSGSLLKKWSHLSLRSNTSGDMLPQGTIRPQHVNASRPGDSPAKHRLPYKPSFTKPTFKWIQGELIGQGSYGRVFMALNATTGEVMAVKQVALPRIANDRLTRQLEVVQALQFESNTLRDLDHPNIVQYLGYEENAETLNIFLEYVPGGTIASCLRNHGKFREEVTKSFTKQILNGLEYLHSKQILHRDMKADNILVEPSGTCKISDFGISKKAEAVNQGRAYTGMKGTVYWMAPEALDSGEGYDVKVDIWSLGCIVQEMWTGLRPWSGEEVVAVMMKLVNLKQPPPLPSDMTLSKSAHDFRNLCFQSDPQQRPSAVILQKHRYLNLPLDWIFKPSDLTKPVAARSQSIAPGKSPLRRNNPPLDVDIPPMPDQGAGGPQTAYQNVATARPSRRPILTPITIPQHPSTNTAPRPKPSRGPSPPLVIITPPGSPKKSASATDWLVRRTSPSTTESSENRSRTSRSSRSRHRRYRVANPDCESDGEEVDAMGNRSATRPRFVFNPPPLPEPTLETPYSSQLAPGTTLRTDDTANLFLQAGCATLLASIGSSARTSSQNTSHSLSRPSSSAPSQKSRDSRRSSEASIYSDSDGESFWQKPPVDLTAPPRSSQERSSARLSSTSSRSTRNYRSSRGARTSINVRGENTWAPRPHVEDVVEHLGEFFPDHDLDQAVSEIGSRRPSVTNGGPGVTRSQNTKSIRRIATEQVTRRQADPDVSRRRTRLWDSRLEEIKT